MPTINSNDFLTQLRQLRDFMAGIVNADNSKLKYSSHYDFVLQHGMEFTPRPLPKGHRKGKAKECYANSVRAMRRNSALVYVEGFVWSNGVAIEHAWCSDRNGGLYEFTLDQPGEAYLGVPFTNAHVIRVDDECATHGVIMRHEDGMSVMRGDPPAETVIQALL